jgi:hypothetical protein
VGPALRWRDQKKGLLELKLCDLSLLGSSPQSIHMVLFASKPGKQMFVPSVCSGQERLGVILKCILHSLILYIA